MVLNSRLAILSVSLLLGLLLSGCATRTGNRAPVEDRVASARPAPVVIEPSASPSAVRPAPGLENAGKPGFYTVKPGDTLIRIGLDTGQNWKDIARWNALDRPNQIEIGQVLRVLPPVSTAAASAAPVGAVTRPVASATANPSPAGTVFTPPAPSALPAPARPVAGAPEGAAADDDLIWAWPVSGPILAGFDEAKNKGLDLGGTAGDAVLAAADGRVVYVGSGLRGYGNLIILKHNNTFLTAYAHNQSLLVKEDQSVRRGQKIAEMGSSDADRVKLHFEVRRQGKPVDPAKLLPVR
jgi:lipoprotein NlpD